VHEREMSHIQKILDCTQRRRTNAESAAMDDPTVGLGVFRQREELPLGRAEAQPDEPVGLDQVDSRIGLAGGGSERRLRLSIQPDPKNQSLLRELDGQG